MSQSTKIVVAVMIGFVVYTTMKGHLRSYLDVLGVV